MANATFKVPVSTGDNRVKYADVTAPVSGGAFALDGGSVGVLGDDSLTPGIPVVFRLSIADQASGDVDYVVVPKVRVLDVWCIKEAADGHASEDTITVKNGTSAITNAMTIGANNDTSVTRASEMNDANQEIAAGGTLRVTVVKGAGGGNNTQCAVNVLCVRVA